MAGHVIKDDPEVRHMAEELRQQAQKPHSTKEELGDVVEELFGANLRSVRTLWVSFRHPLRYAKAALTPDWDGGRYTPSVRLFLALFSIFAVTAFFWFDRYIEDIDIDEGALGQKTFLALFLAVIFGWTLFGAWFLRWRKSVGFAANIRLWFAASVPPTALSFLDEVQSAFHPPSWEVPATALSVVVFIGVQFAYLRFGPAAALQVPSPNRLIAKYLLVLYTFGLVLSIVAGVIIVASGAFVAGFASGFADASAP